MLTRPESHQHFAKWHALRHPAGAPASRLQTAPCSLQQHKHPDSKTPIDILQPQQHPGPNAHTKHLANRSLKAQLVTFDYAGVKRSVRHSTCQRAVLRGSTRRIWTGSRVGWWPICAPEPTRCPREVYAKPTPVPGVPWQKSGESFGSSKSLMALIAKSRWKAENIKTPVGMDS